MQDYRFSNITLAEKSKRRNIKTKHVNARKSQKSLCIVPEQTHPHCLSITVASQQHSALWTEKHRKARGTHRKACGTHRKACGTHRKACGTHRKGCGTHRKACGTEKHVEHTEKHVEHTEKHVGHTEKHVGHTEKHVEHTEKHVEHAGMGKWPRKPSNNTTWTVLAHCYWWQKTKQGACHCCFGQCRSNEQCSERYKGIACFLFPTSKRSLEDCKARIRVCGRHHDQILDQHTSPALVRPLLSGRGWG